MERYYSVREICERTGFPRSTIYRAIKEGELPALRPNGTSRGQRVSESDWEAWRAKRTARVA